MTRSTIKIFYLVKSAVIPAFLALAIGISPAGYASGVAHATIKSVGNPQMFRVKFNKTKGQYDVAEVVKHNTSTLDDPVEYTLDFGGTCEPGHFLEKSEIKLVLDQNVQTYEWSGKTNYDHTTKTFGSYATKHFRVVDACNKALKTKAGMKGGTVEAFTLWQVPLHTAQNRLYCTDSQEPDTAYASIKYDILCETAHIKSRQSPAALGAGFSVSQVKAVVAPPMSMGRCPVKMTLAIELRGVGKGTARFRVVDSDGHQSGVYTAHLKKAGNGYRTHVVQTFQAPDDAGGSGKAGGSTGGGLVAKTAKPSGPVASSSMTMNSGNPNRHKKSFRVEVFEPNHIVSNWTAYDITCNNSSTVPATGNLTGGIHPTHGGGIQPAQPVMGTQPGNDNKKALAVPSLKSKK